jgi:phosphoribosylformylglycinamidine synthase PurS subunit
MGYEGIVDVLVGKYIILEMEEDTEETRDSVKKMCDAILANTVIEKYEIEYLNES